MSSSFVRENYIFPDHNSEEYDVKLRQYLNALGRAVNSKDSGLYSATEVVTGKKFLPIFGTDKSSSATYRDVFRTVVDTGQLPNGTKNIAHGITIDQNFSLVSLYGAGTAPNPTGINNGIPLPFTDTTTPLHLSIDQTDIIIITSSAAFLTYTRSFVVIEYIKTL